MTEREFGEAVAKMGGRAYVVGGWVRDKVRGQAPQDKDYVVTGVTEAAFRAAMPEAKLVGRGFPVFLAKIDDACCEVAFARTERKNGTGYRGFDVSCSVDERWHSDLAGTAMAYAGSCSYNSSPSLGMSICCRYGPKKKKISKKLKPVPS